LLTVQILKSAVLSLVTRFHQVVAIGVVPVLIATLIYLQVVSSADRYIVTLGIAAPLFLQFIANLLMIPLVSWIAVNWHRAVILGVKSRFLPVLGWPSWAHLWRFVVLFFVVALIYCVYFFIIGTLLENNTNVELDQPLFMPLVMAGAVFTVWLSTFVFLRLSPCMASHAVGNGITLKHSWFLTGQHKVAIGVIAIVLPAVLIALFIGAAAVAPFSFSAFPAAMLVFVYIVIAVLTEIYDYMRATDDVAEVFG